MKIKTKHSLIIGILLLANATNYIFAQKNEQTKPKRWAADFSVASKGLFNITQAKVTYLLNPQSKNKSEIGLGFLLQPESTTKLSEGFNTDGIYSAKMATIAFRQYVYKGFHFEEDFNIGQGAISKNKVDGKDYKSTVIFAQSLMGYKWNLLKRDKCNLFVMGQGGFGYAYNKNHWPSNGSPSFFGLGDLKIGVSF